MGESTVADEMLPHSSVVALSLLLNVFTDQKLKFNSEYELSKPRGHLMIFLSR